MSDRIVADCPSCSSSFTVAASFAGKKIRCPNCQGVIPLPGGATPPDRNAAQKPTRTASSEPRVARPVRNSDGSATERSNSGGRSSSRERPGRGSADGAGSGQPGQRRRRPENPAPPQPATTRKKKSAANYDGEVSWEDMTSDSYGDDPYGQDPYGEPSAKPPRKRQNTSKFVSPTTAPSGKSGGVLTGILMMVGAVVWFFGGLAFDVLFYYPPVLFIVGLVTTIKGAMSAG